MRRGWYNDRWRHSLAAKGIKTSYLKKKASEKRRIAAIKKSWEEADVTVINLRW